MFEENKFFILLVGSASILLLIFGIVLAGKTQPPTLEAASNAKVEVLSESKHDWGQIDIEGGDVMQTFQIRNGGESDLEITNFKTSCMCTEAQVSIKEEESPIFGMHTRSGWKGVIEPGETADILVVFDPLFHGPQGTGPITRLVSFSTNDSDNPVVEFKLEGNVVRIEN